MPAVPPKPVEAPRLLRSSASLFSAEVTAAIGYFAFGLLVARTAGPAARGAVAFVTALALLLGYASTLGVEVANLFFAGREPRVRPNLVTASLLVGLVCGAAAGAGAWGLLTWQDEWVPGAVTNEFLLLGAATTALITTQILVEAALIGSDEISWANAARIAVPLVTVGCFLVAAVPLDRPTPAAALVSWVLGRVAGFGLAVGAASARIGVGRTGVLDSVRKLLRFGLPAHLGALADIPIRRLDSLILGATWGAAELGIYTVAVNGAEAMMYLPSSVASALLPRAASQSHRASGSLVRRSVLAVTLGSIVVSALGIALAPQLVRLVFGDEFASAATPLRLLLVAMVAMGIRVVLRAGLVARRRQVVASIAALVTLAVILALDIWLIPKYGADGAAGASLVAYWFGAALIVYAFSRTEPADRRSEVTGETLRDMPLD